VQVRYVLGYRHLGEGYFDLRTPYHFFRQDKMFFWQDGSQQERRQQKEIGKERVIEKSGCFSLIRAIDLLQWLLLTLQPLQCPVFGW